MAAASIINPLNSNCRALTERSTCRHNNDVEIKVTYVRIITSAPMPSTIAVAFFPPGEAESSLTVNGKAAAPVLALRRSRADAAAGESVYLSTDLMRFAGGCLGFEIRGRQDGGGAASPLVVGLMVRKGGGKYAMQCIEAGGLDGGLVDVYFVGSSGGRAVLLNNLVEVRKRSDCFVPIASEAQVAIADAMGLGKGIMEEENGDMENGEGREIEEDEEEEFSWFSEGVRVGMGLGLAMSLGVGVGVSLAMKSLQAAATVLKRLM